MEEKIAVVPRSEMADAAAEGVQDYLHESGNAIDNLERVRKLISRSMDMRLDAALISDANLAELQAALTPPKSDFSNPR
jgi:hypothetical protein